MPSLLSMFGRGPKDRTTEIMARHLDQDFTSFPMAEEKVTGRQIDEIERKFGVVYPPEFRAHVLGRFPGVFIEVQEAVWPRPKPFDVGPFWSFLYGLHTYTPAPSSEEWMRLEVAAAEFRDAGLHAAPILRVIGDADVYCVDAKGAIVRYDHEQNTLNPSGLDFWGVFDFELRELRERKNRKKSGPHGSKEAW